LRGTASVRVALVAASAPDFFLEDTPTAVLVRQVLGAVIVESPDRFARDLTVQLTGHDYLKGLGVALVAASAPDFFLEDTPTAVLVRQVLGAIAQFDKATTIAKLKAARDRKRTAEGKCEGRKSYAERDPALVGRAKELSEQRPRLSLRDIAAELASEGRLTPSGVHYSASAVASMLA
jgi:DNA invertase Pin-like site-specific DNA recombinase